MRSRPLAGYGALIISSVALAACSVSDVYAPFSDPVPTASIPAASAPVEPISVTPVTPFPIGAAPAPIAAAPPAAAPASPVQVEPVQTAAARVTPAPQHFGFPRLGLPGFRDNAGGMPAEEVQCRRRLKRLGVSFRDIAPIRDSASCGIDHPVEVTSLARGIRLTPTATLTCAMAEELARWAQSDLAPAARTRYLSGIAEVRQMSSYSCRRIRGSGKWSAHSTGNALDIGAVKLKNGRVIKVQRQGPFAFRARGLLRSVRGGACGHFNTVLGPGYDRDHADHFHFDLMQRRSSRRYCR